MLVRACILAIVAIALVAPGAAAAAVSGELAFSPDTHFLGRLEIATDRGALDLSPSIKGGESVSVAWDAAVGYERVYPWTTIAGPIGPPFRVAEDIVETPLSWGAGALSSFTCGEPCVALIVAEGGGRLALAGESAGPLRWMPASETIFAGMQGTDPDSGFVYTMPAGWLRASGEAPMGLSTMLADARASGEGTLTLVLFNASATRVVDNVSGTLDTRTRNEESANAGPAGRVDRTMQRYVLLELKGARVDVDSTRSATLVTPTAQLGLDGSLEADSASGTLSIDGRERRIEREPLRLDGALDLSVRIELLRTEVEGEPLLSSGPRAAIAGSSSYAVVDGAAILDEAKTRAAVLAGAGALVGIAVLIRVALSKGVLHVLYSRIRTTDVLQSEPRARIHAAITANPGIRTSELGRLVGMRRVVLEHHVRILRAHGFIVFREKRFYPAGAAPSTDVAASRVALEDATRRALAEAVVAWPTGATQKELADGLSLSVRLVSHHLRRLEAHGLVARQGARPSRFVASQSLLALLRSNDGRA